MLSERLKELRSKEKLTLEQLSKFSGVSKSAISAIEKGDIKNPSMDSINKLAEILKCTADYLTGKVNKADNIYVPKQELPAPLGDYMDGMSIVEKAYKAGLSKEDIEKIIDYAIDMKKRLS